MEVLNRAAIKKDARAFIGQETRWWKMFLAMLPIMLLSGGVSSGITVWRTVTEINQQGDVPNTTYSAGVNIISLLLIPFTFAVGGYFLNHIRGFNPSWQSLYKEGLDRYGAYLKTGFITNLIVGLWTLLLIVPGIIKALAYSQVQFIIHDNPTLSPKQARDISDRMTEGFKGDLFVLGFSFFLWFLFIGITFGIGTIYVIPYLQTTLAMYYENLKSYALANGKVRPEELGIMPVPPYGNVPPAGAPYTAPTQPPYAANQNPYAAPTQPPYAANPNPYAAPAQPPYTANPNPYAAPTEPPYAANPNPYAAPTQPPYVANPNPYAAPTEPPYAANPTPSSFTPPAPEETFQPGDVSENADKTVLNGEEIDSEQQDF